MKGISRPLWKQGEQFAAERLWSEAISTFEQILNLSPTDASAMLRLSSIHSLAGHYREGRRYALQAHAAAPKKPEVVAELISRLRTFNEPRAVLENIKRLGPLNRVSIPLLLQFAQRLSFLNLQTDALRFIDEAWRGDPGFPPTLAARAQVLTYLGRFDEARRDLANCLARAPEFARPHWLLSRLRKWTAEDNHVARLQIELKRPGRKPDDIVLLSYALHKELDDLGRYDEAWLALDLACKTRRAAIQYRSSDTVALVDELTRMPAMTCVDTAPAGEPVPIFVVGMHRSGTTLLEQILAGHSQVRDMGELYDFTAQMRLACDHHCRGVIDMTIVERALSANLAAAGRGYLDGIAWRLQGKRFAVDKLPSNFLNLGFILSSIPAARVLHMVRDPMETCFSNHRELFSDACLYSYDQVELADYFGQYQRLMAHWHERFPGRIMDVLYDDLVGRTDQTTRAITEFCAMGYEPAMLDLDARPRVVATASAVQVRGKIEKPPVPKWKPYEAQLGPLLERLGALAARS